MEKGGENGREVGSLEQETLSPSRVSGALAEVDVGVGPVQAVEGRGAARLASSSENLMRRFGA